MPAADPRYYFLVAQAASALRHAADAATLAAAGVTAAQAGALFAIAAGQVPPSQRQLGATLGLGDAAVTGMVNRLERLGLVRREVDPTDSRARRLTLSDQGRAALDAIEPARRRLNTRIAEALGDDAEQVSAALSRLARLDEEVAVARAPARPDGA